ncbi:complex I subunit 5 family protein [Sorangium sp. So ce1335]|uniref:complex I subunit 5 family protein n=1 Tax=Sorangium sp. So ce1335 TaxID=3133335 RepID=UPI003F614BA3
MTLDGLAAEATIAAFAFPLLLAAGMPNRFLRPLAAALAPWAALPALILAVALHGRATIVSSAAVLGMRLGSAGTVTRGFLLLTACLWLVSSLFARAYLAGDPHRPRFWVFFLATLSGNVGLVLAEDVASFYLFYGLMTFAAYGLIVHDGTGAARRAGRVYIVMALLGEMSILGAFLLIVGADINVALQDVPRVVAASATRELVAALVLVGFGVKAGALFLHMWLPLAHPAAPIPASAVLSGAMIKAGVLGWLRFLPLGAAALPAHGSACMVAGIAAAFFGVALGLTQRESKTILAYSSVSQMGFMTAALGVGLSNPGAAPAVVAAILFYAMHHALAKGALFLGTGVARATGSGWPGGLVALGLSLPALDLAGAPLSSGSLAKISLKDIVAQAPWGTTWLPWLLSAGAVASTLLMIHFVRRTLPRSAERLVPGAGLWVPWASLLLLDVVLLVRPPIAPADLGLLVAPGTLWAAAWPVLAGAAIAAAGGRLLRRGPRVRVELPPGDLLYPIDAALMKLKRVLLAARGAWASVDVQQRGARLVPIGRLSDRLLGAVERGEVALSAFGAIGLLFLLLAVLVAAAQRF